MKQKIIATHLLITMMTFSLSAQEIITGTLVEEWNLDKRKLHNTYNYNRVSSYIYLINNNKLIDLFTNVDFTKEERNALKIKKEDQADFLYMGVSVTHPQVANGEKIQIPLFLYDYRKGKGNIPSYSNAFSNFNGKYISNVKDEYLHNTISGEITIRALISNANSKFWSDIAGITSEVGNTAMSLANGNPTDLTKDLSKLIGKGMDALKTVRSGDKEKINSFFIDLVSYQESANYKEIVSSARLYKIHWTKETHPETTNYFSSYAKDNDTIKPNDLRNKIKDAITPYILVIETRSEYQINLGDPTFSAEYKGRMEKEWKELRAGENRDMAKNYSVIFSTAYTINENINSFNESLKGQSIDASSLIRIIDNYYKYKQEITKQDKKYGKGSQSDEIIQTSYSEYKNRYETIDLKLDNLLRGTGNSFHLNNGYNVVKSLLFPIDYTKNNEQQLYAEIETLRFYTKLKADREGIIKNESFDLADDLLGKYEAALYTKASTTVTGTADEKLKVLDLIIAKYPFCAKCVESAGKQRSVIHQDTRDAVEATYVKLSDNEWTEFQPCKDRLYFAFTSVEMDKRINDNTDFSEATKQRYRVQKEKFITWVNTYDQNLSRPTKDAKLDDLIGWTTNLTSSKTEMLKIASAFYVSKLVTKPDGCPKPNVVVAGIGNSQ